MTDILFCGIEFYPINGYEGRYYVSKCGKVLSHKRTGFRILKGCESARGRYVRVYFSVGGLVKAYLVHRLVALTFIPNPGGKSEVNHINLDKTDNQLHNLEWVTPSENMAHAVDLGVYDAWAIKKRKQVVGFNIKTGEIVEFNSIKEAGESTGTNRGCISNVCLGKARSVGGYLWSYV